MNKNIEDMKVKLFTHTDLDGVGCAIVAKQVFSNLEVEYCDYHNVDQKIHDYLALDEKHDLVFITDISVNEEVAEMIDKSDIRNKIVLIDHHPTAEWLNKYEWAIVEAYQESLCWAGKTVKASGTSLLYHYFTENDNLKLNLSVDKSVNLFYFVEEVRQYDSWDWFNKFNRVYPKQLNDLFWIIGREKFVNRFSTNLNPDFSKTEKLILEIEQNRIDKYISDKEEKMFTYNVFDHNAGVVFADRYHSELGNVLATNHPELDFIIIINPSDAKVSYRGIKDNIDLGKIAKLVGGGGHPKSAGSQFDTGKITSFVESIFQ